MVIFMENNSKLINILNILMETALAASIKGEIPVAAAVVDKDLNIISVCGNNRQSTCNVLGHAEILAIQQAEQSIKDWRLDGYSMIVTLVPCEMCRSVIKESRLDKVYYLADRNNNEQLDNNLYQQLNDFPEYIVKSSDLLTAFFDNMR